MVTIAGRIVNVWTNLNSGIDDIQLRSNPTGYEVGRHEQKASSILEDIGPDDLYGNREKMELRYA